MHHNCDALIGMDQDLCIGCKMNVEENNRQRYSSRIPLFPHDRTFALYRNGGYSLS